MFGFDFELWAPDTIFHNMMISTLGARRAHKNNAMKNKVNRNIGKDGMITLTKDVDKKHSRVYVNVAVVILRTFGVATGPGWTFLDGCTTNFKLTNLGKLGGWLALVPNPDLGARGAGLPGIWEVVEGLKLYDVKE